MPLVCTLCSCGGEICTAQTPAGPSTLSHSFAMSSHRHSKRCTKTLPAALIPVATYVCGSDGRTGSGLVAPVGTLLSLPLQAANASAENARSAVRAVRTASIVGVGKFVVACS